MDELVKSNNGRLSLIMSQLAGLSLAGEAARDRPANFEKQKKSYFDIQKFVFFTKSWYYFIFNSYSLIS